MNTRPLTPGARPLGTTGLEVSPIGLGLAVLDAAWRGGVRYLDAARSYGRAESFLATWLATHDVAPADVVIGSKWGYTYTAGWRVDVPTHEVKDHSQATFARQWRETRERLGAHLDLYQVHSLTPRSPLFTDARLLDDLSRLRDEGVHLGFSTSGPEQAAVIDRALELRVDGVRLFDTVQATWNLLETSVGPALADAHDAGVGIIVKEALANGRLDVAWDGDADEALRSLAEAPAAYWSHRAELAWT